MVHRAGKLTLPSRGHPLTKGAPKKGHTVPIDGVVKPFSILKKPGTEFQPWKVQVVVSSFPRERLPTNIRQNGARQLCEISSVLKTQEVRRLFLHFK